MREASGKRKQQALVTSECRKERNKEEERLKKKSKNLTLGVTLGKLMQNKETKKACSSRELYFLKYALLF